MVAAAVAAVAYARDWRRLRALAVSGFVAAAAALLWANRLSDGVFAETLRFQIGRLGTRSVGMWSIDSGFADMRRLASIETPRQLAVAAFTEFFRWRATAVPTVLFVAALLAIPVWMGGAARSRPAVRLFSLLWPLSYLFVDFVALDFVSPRYFVPFTAFAAVLVVGWIWRAQRYVPTAAVAAVGAVACLGLALESRPALSHDIDPWYWGRIAWIGENVPSAVSFSPMLFVATGREPGCGFVNPALTYRGFGEAWLLTERTRRFRFTDERLIDCLRKHPDMRIVIDWAFYFFTRPGSDLRAYLAGEGAGQRLFFSPDAVQQWDRPLLQMSPLR